MSGGGAADGSGPSRRAVLVGGGLLATIAVAGGARALAAAAADAPVAPVPTRPAPASAKPALPAPPPPFVGAPVAGVQLHPAARSQVQSFVRVPETGEWFTTQAQRGTSGLIDPAGLPVDDIVVSRLGPDGALLDAMLLPDSGHGMGIVVRMEEGVPVVRTCWFAPDASGRLYDVVRLPYAAGTAARLSATPVVPGIGYPLDPYYDASTDTVTVRHQGGPGPQYTRHSWVDFAAGDLSRPTGGIATPDSPPTHQGFCSFGDRFFFYTGAPTDVPGGDPVLIAEYSWTTGTMPGPALDASGNARQPDGTYPGGRIEPEGAAVLVDEAGIPWLHVGVVTGGGRLAIQPKACLLFRYPLASV